MISCCYSTKIKNITQSIEPNIADLVNGWLKSYKVNYKLEQESLNTEIDTLRLSKLPRKASMVLMLIYSPKSRMISLLSGDVV